MKVKNQLALIYLFITYSVSKETVKVRTKEITTIRLGGSPSASPSSVRQQLFLWGASFRPARGGGQWPVFVSRTSRGVGVHGEVMMRSVLAENRMTGGNPHGSVIALTWE